MTDDQAEISPSAGLAVAAAAAASAASRARRRLIAKWVTTPATIRPPPNPAHRPTINEMSSPGVGCWTSRNDPRRGEVQVTLPSAATEVVTIALASVRMLNVLAGVGSVSMAQDRPEEKPVSGVSVMLL